jgi:hypothetical protein
VFLVYVVREKTGTTVIIAYLLTRIAPHGMRVTLKDSGREYGGWISNRKTVDHPSVHVVNVAKNMVPHCDVVKDRCEGLHICVGARLEEMRGAITQCRGWFLTVVR